MSGYTTQTATTVKGAPTKYVKLNVGGSLHYATLGTLTKQDNMLRAMFSGRMEVLTDTEGTLMLQDTFEREILTEKQSVNTFLPTPICGFNSLAKLENDDLALHI
jgi:hypothetical protein